jgi:hypothetical protein
MHALLELGFGSSEPISAGSNVLTSREFFLELSKRRMVETGKEVVLGKIEVRGGTAQGGNNSLDSKSLIFSTRMTILLAP